MRSRHGRPSCNSSSGDSTRNPGRRAGGDETRHNMTMLPSTTWQMLANGPSAKPLPRGLDALWDKAVGSIHHLVPRTRRFLEQARRICAMEKQFADLTDGKLREQAIEMRQLYRRGKDQPADIERAFAVIREVAFRQRGEKPFPVQVAGALALYHGCIAEMATGEGKTLTATMPATVAGWRGRGCHVITVNDYLAKRDAENMNCIYRFCELHAQAVEQEMQPDDRRRAYQADITYVTNKEVTADFLRDRLVLGKMRGLTEALITKLSRGGMPGVDRVVQRGLAFAIVDEADSILIDEAVTPLIISSEGPNPQQAEAFQQASMLAEQMQPGVHYRTDDRYREVEIAEEGKRRLADLAQSLGGLWTGARRREELVTYALTARHYYLRDKQYAVMEGKVVIIDEFTGRLMPGREWRDGLHQAVEAKEGIQVNPPKDTCARISFQRFFRLYRKLGGMTGTAAEAWREFWQIYHLPVAVIPTNRPCIRKRPADRVFATETAKWNAIVEEIRRVHKTGQPVLIGTRSVRASENLSTLLSLHHLEHQVLNAVRHAEEAHIVAGAGQPGKITVSTNMAGRGTDIKLGRGVAELGGLYVLATERHEAGRIDRQLYGRSARQGDPGTAQTFVSLEDELPNRYAPHISSVVRKRHGQGERDVSSPSTRMLFDLAQRRAERLALRQRKGVLHTDDWLDEYLGFAGKE